MSVNKVRMIPATIHIGSTQQVLLGCKRPVCGYARVSTDSDEQETSYEAQVDYYTKYIKSRPDWEFKGIYTDDGVSATNTKKRDGFNRMVQDALAGKFSLIVTKSVSRFARNTVDSLTTVRLLKEHGVEVYFQKENIYTLDSKGELLITIMSSLAQEESRSISENVTWGMRKRFSDGKVSLPYAQFLGYEKGEDGVPQIVESEAKIVRLIFRLFIEGKTPSAIVRHLERHGISSPAGKKTWQVATVRSILGNEKYKGDALLQKGFTVDFLTKTRKANEGEIPQYYVEGSHPAIITPEEFDAVQAEMARRKKLGRPVGCGSPFSSRIICGDCGGFYGPKVWGSNTKYRRTVWRCNDKYGKGHKCQTPHLTEEQLQQGFLTAFGQLAENREELLENCRLAQAVLCDCMEIDRKLAKLHHETEVENEQARKAIRESARGDGEVSQHNVHLARLRKIKDKVAKLESERADRQGKAVLIQAFIREIEGRELMLDAFDERLWMVAVESVTVQTDGSMTFRLRDGSEMAYGGHNRTGISQALSCKWVT